MGKTSTSPNTISTSVKLEDVPTDLVLHEAHTVQIANDKSSSGGVKISGLALPFGVPSRNGVEYSKKSIIATYKMLSKRVMLFNHNQDFPVGHVEEVYIKDEVGLFYTADIHPEVVLSGGVKLADMIRRGDINSVSISVLPNKHTVEEIGEDHIMVDVNDWIELSVVTTPGFIQTSATVLEALHEAARGRMLTKEDIQEPMKDNIQDNIKTETVEVELMTEKDEKKESSEKDENSINSILDERLKNVEKLLVTHIRREQDDDEDEPDNDEDEDEKCGKKRRHSVSMEQVVSIERRLETIEEILTELSPALEKLKEDFKKGRKRREQDDDDEDDDDEKERSRRRRKEQDDDDEDDDDEEEEQDDDDDDDEFDDEESIKIEKKQSFSSSRGKGKKQTPEELQRKKLLSIVNAQQESFLKEGK